MSSATSGSDGGSDEREYEVGRIVATRVKNKQRQYKIKWKGYGPKYNTWEPEYEIRVNCSDLIDDFLRKNKQKKYNSRQRGRITKKVSAPKRKKTARRTGSSSASATTEQAALETGQPSSSPSNPLELRDGTSGQELHGTRTAGQEYEANGSAGQELYGTRTPGQESGANGSTGQELHGTGTPGQESGADGSGDEESEANGSTGQELHGTESEESQPQDNSHDEQEETVRVDNINIVYNDVAVRNMGALQFESAYRDRHGTLVFVGRRPEIPTRGLYTVNEAINADSTAFARYLADRITFDNTGVPSVVLPHESS